MAPLSEQSGISGTAQPEDVFFQRGVAFTGIQSRLLDSQGAAVDASLAPARTPDGSVTLSALDYKMQEDARRLTWSGQQPGAWELRAKQPRDFDRQANGDLLLTATLRIDALPSQGHVVAYAASAGGRSELQIGSWLQGLPQQQWMTVAIPLKCFRRGADLKRLEVPLGIRSAPGLQLSIHQVQLGAAAEHLLDCPAS